MNCSMPGLPLHHHLPEFTQTHIHWVGDAIQPSHPLSSPSLPAPNPSQHQSLFQWVNSLHEVEKVLEFPLKHHSFQREHLGLISFRMDWLDLLAVQGTLKSLLQHHSSKASVLWHSAFFIVQLSHPYMTKGKTIREYRTIPITKLCWLILAEQKKNGLLWGLVGHFSRSVRRNLLMDLDLCCVICGRVQRSRNSLWRDQQLKVQI